MSVRDDLSRSHRRTLLLGILVMSGLFLLGAGALAGSPGATGVGHPSSLPTASSSASAVSGVRSSQGPQVTLTVTPSTIVAMNQTTITLNVTDPIAPPAYGNWLGLPAGCRPTAPVDDNVSFVCTANTVGAYLIRISVWENVTGGTFWSAPGAYLSVTNFPPWSPLAATISASPDSGTAPLNVTFSAQVSGGSGAIVPDWAFGVGQFNSTLSSPTFEYTAPGTYEVNATFWDVADGNALTVRHLNVTVSAPPLSVAVTPVRSSLPGAEEIVVTADITGTTGPTHVTAWSLNGTNDSALGTGLTATYVTTHPGSYVFRAWAADARNDVVVSPAVTAAGPSLVNSPPPPSTFLGSATSQADLVGGLVGGVVLGAIVALAAGSAKSKREREAAERNPPVTSLGTLEEYASIGRSAPPMKKGEANGTSPVPEEKLDDLM